MDGEPGALAWRAFDVDGPIVRFDDPGDKAEPQSEALIGAGRRAGPRNSVKPIENMRQILFRYASPRIFHDDFNGTGLRSELHPYLAAFRSELDGIREQVGNHAFHLYPVDLCGALVWGVRDQPDALGFCWNLELLDQFADQIP